jgi:hypothetical protein
MPRRRRDRQFQEDEQFHIAFSDLFAGMIGVTMIFVIFFFSTAPLTQFLVKKTIPFSNVLSRYITRVKYLGGFAETIYCNVDHILVPGLNRKRIEYDNIMTDNELKQYLRKLYLEEKGKVLLMTNSASYSTEDSVKDLLYEMGREDERFLHFKRLFIHKNLDFILDEDLKREYRKKLGIE